MVRPEARAEASMVRALLMTSCPELRVMVPPSRVASKVRLPPTAAVVIASRREPEPASASEVTRLDRGTS